MTKEEIKDLQERFDARYKLRDECDHEMTAVAQTLSKDATQLAVINTKLSLIIWLLSVLGAAVVGFLVKYILGG